MSFFHFVTMHAFDRQTDRRMDIWTERFSQYHVLHCMQSHGKNVHRLQYQHVSPFHIHDAGVLQVQELILCRH